MEARARSADELGEFCIDDAADVGDGCLLRLPRGSPNRAGSRAADRRPRLRP